MTAFVYGATGLVGQTLLRLLLDDSDYTQVHVLARRSVAGLTDHSKVSLIVSDFDAFIASGRVPAVDHVFSALGTTIKVAGSREAFRKVDFEYVVEVAKMASNSGVSRFVLVSALGADRKSFFFYNRVKGEVESAVSEIGFESTVILRPSLIVGEREQVRRTEQIWESVLKFVPKNYRPVQALDIAACMIREAKGDAHTGGVILSRHIA